MINSVLSRMKVINNTCQLRIKTVSLLSVVVQ